MLLSVRTFSRMLRMMVSSSDWALILGVGLARLSYVNTCHNETDRVKDFWGDWGKWLKGGMPSK